jgi:hypothetical protein
MGNEIRTRVDLCAAKGYPHELDAEAKQRRRDQRKRISLPAYKNSLTPKGDRLFLWATRFELV